MAELNIAADTVFRLIEILHEITGQDQGLEREDPEEEGDDSAAEGLAGEPDDARLEEATSLLRDLNVDEQTDLAALILVGREEFDVTEFTAAKVAARDYLGDDSVRELGALVLGDAAAAEFLEEGMEAFGYRFADWDAEAVVGEPETEGDHEPGDVADDAQRQTPGRVGRT